MPLRAVLTRNKHGGYLTKAKSALFFGILLDPGKWHIPENAVIRRKLSKSILRCIPRMMLLFRFFCICLHFSFSAMFVLAL